MNGFYIIIKDNFFKESAHDNLKENVSYLSFDANLSGFEGGLKGTHYTNKNHTWFSTPVDIDTQKIIEEKCSKILNKNLKTNICVYTMLGKTKPMPHCDASNECDYQAIIYIKGNEELNKGTGFYIKKDNNLELNTHVGFIENRSIIWHSNTFHTPLNFASDDKSRRYSIICQFKELR